MLGAMNVEALSAIAPDTAEVEQSDRDPGWHHLDRIAKGVDERSVRQAMACAVKAGAVARTWWRQSLYSLSIAGQSLS